MKLVGLITFIGLLALVMNCSVPETAIVSDPVVNVDPELDSLELARKNRVDSASQIKMPSTVKAPKKIRIPPSTNQKKQ